MALGTQTAKELRLIREQTAHFTRDLGNIRKELAAVKAKQEEDVAVVIERKVVELLQIQANDLEEFRTRTLTLERDLGGQWDEFDAVRRLVQDVESTFTKQMADFRTSMEHDVKQDCMMICRQLEDRFADRVQARHNVMEERLLQLEKAHAHEGISSAERGTRAELALRRLEQLERGLAECQAKLSGQGPTQEDIQGLSRALAASSEASSRELVTVHTTLEQLRGRLLDFESQGATITDLKESLAREAAAAELRLGCEVSALAARQAPLQERVEQLEKRVVETKHATQGDNALVKRLDNVERALGDSADRHPEGMAAMQGQVDSLHNRLLACEASCRSAAHGAEKVAPVSLAEEQRVAELQALKAEHFKLAGEVHARHAELSDLIAQERERRLEEQPRSALESRVECLEELVRESASTHDRALSAVRSDHVKLTGEAKARDIRHAALEERLASVEDVVSSSAEEHSRGVSATNAMLDQFQRRLADDRAARDQHHSFVRELFSKEKEERSADHNVTVDRLDRLEQQLADGALRQAAELKATQVTQSKLAGEVKLLQKQRVALAERIDTVENVRERLEGLIQTQAARHPSEPGLDQVRKQAIDDRLDFVLGQVNSLQQAGDETHAFLAERLAALEKAFEVSVLTSTQELRVAQARLEKMQGRMAKVRAVWSREVEPMEDPKPAEDRKATEDLPVLELASLIGKPTEGRSVLEVASPIEKPIEGGSVLEVASLIEAAPSDVPSVSEIAWDGASQCGSCANEVAANLSLATTTMGESWGD